MASPKSGIFGKMSASRIINTHQAASRWAGCRAAGAALVSRFVQNRFVFGCIIAPEFDFREFGRRDWPREARGFLRTDKFP